MIVFFITVIFPSLMRINEEMKEDEQDKDNSFDHIKDVTAALKRGKRNASKEKR